MQIGFGIDVFCFASKAIWQKNSVSALAGNGLKPAIPGESGGKQSGFGSENYLR
ncbi:MAG: hypothetical protein ACTHOP_10770 [Mesorhizobium sp.]